MIMRILPFAFYVLGLSFDGAAAFSVTRSAAVRSSTPVVRLALQKNDEDSECGTITRRGLFRSATIMGGAASLIKPSSARAATVTAKKSIPSSVVSTTLCDPSVSTWVKTYGDAMRTVHILGTAHISSASAELAGKLVRDIRPNVVFVELDKKRVARAIPEGGKDGGIASSNVLGGSGASSGADGVSTSAIASDASEGKEMASVTTPITSTPNDTTIPNKRSNPFNVQSRLEDAGSKVVGDSVKKMYGKLESEGFKAGDEFAMSVREGLSIGSTIVLGDRDVEVTLKRLTRALAKTDIRKLLSPDSEVEKSMEELLPESMKDQLNSQGGSGGGSKTSMGIEDVAIDKGEFTTFVETMKAKENVKKIMNALKSTAPEIYEAMVAERDVYMAAGLDELGDTLSEYGRSVETTVAVMGMAHVDGVETYLANKGWRQMTYPCPVTR